MCFLCNVGIYVIYDICAVCCVNITMSIDHMSYDDICHVSIYIYVYDIYDIYIYIYMSYISYI